MNTNGILDLLITRHKEQIIHLIRISSFFLFKSKSVKSRYLKDASVVIFVKTNYVTKNCKCMSRLLLRKY